LAADLRSKDSLPELAERLVRSYGELAAIEHLDERPLPRPQAVLEIIQDLKELIFPGYGSRRNLDWSRIAETAGGLLAGLHGRLCEQIACALRHEAEAGRDGAGDEGRFFDLDLRAQRKSIQLLESLPRLRRLIATDVQAAYDGDPAAGSLHEIVCSYPGLEAVTVYRLAHELHGLGVPLLPRMMTEWAHSRTGIDIHPGARIGPGFFIDHGTGVVIGETCEIADHVKLYQGVTLGALSFQTDGQGNLVRGTKRHPTIQRRVVIYANATVLGGATIVGAGAVIGAGVSITKSVPANTIVTVEKPSLRFREAS
jgi:serine O-acetyltransferase